MPRSRVFPLRMTPWIAAGALVCGSAITLAAHDFWLVPSAFQIAIGDTAVAYGQTSSRFPTTESAVATDRVAEARLIGPANATPIRDLTVHNKSLRLRARPDAPGQYVIAARLNWRSTRESAASFRRYLRLEGATGPRSSFLLPNQRRRPHAPVIRPTSPAPCKRMMRLCGRAIAREQWRCSR